jgi:hypothetical protein
MQRAFNAGPDAPFMDPAVMAWKYWDHRGDWDGPRAYVLEQDGAIVAHAGIYPLTFSAGEVRGIRMMDWVAANEHPGSGLALLRKLDSMFDFIYSIGGSEKLDKFTEAYGYVEHARQWKGARPLRPFQQVLKHQYRNWKLAPRLIRNFIWSLPKPPNSNVYKGWKSEEITPDEVSEEFYSKNLADAYFSPRPAAFFEYLLRCPVVKMRLYGIHDDRGPQGHFAIGVLRGQARVAGVWLHNPDCEAWQAVFSLAQQAAMQFDGACEIMAEGTEGLSERCAALSGLRIMAHNPIYLLNKKKAVNLSPNLQFQFSDDHRFFLDSGDSYFLS